MSSFIKAALCSLSLALAGNFTAAVAEAALHPGESGDNIVTLQQKLREVGYAINIDGSFGRGTVKVVKHFQQQHGLTADGVVGHDTQMALFGYEPFPNPAPVVSQPTPAYDRGGSEAVQRLLAIANGLQGVPYVWGGSSSNGFDCSGFVQYVFASVGVSLPRTCDVQFNVGLPVEKSNLEPGDVVFFETYTTGPSHVGIYLSDGMFIHASSAEGQVTLDTLNRDYRIKTYIGARRML